jgi:hypothetical protein
LYYVLIKPGGKPLGYRQKGGGTYTDKKYAESQYESLKAYGSNVELHVAEMDWTLVKSSQDDATEGQPTLW